MPDRISIKTLCLLTFVFFAFTANATNYYFSTSGNNANSGTDPSSPWQTLNKLNSFKNLKPGDNVLFKRGDTFYGSITVNNSGIAGNPIIFGAYGTGANPIISGFTNVSSWTNLGGNIWESTSAISTLSSLNMVTVNGINTPMGRYPNSGYLTFQSHSGTTSITSSALTGTPNWTGAEVVIRSTQWTLERKTITSQSSGTLSYSATDYQPTDGFGFFIQNDARTLDQQNEWYYNPSTKKIRVYSTSSPSNVQIATSDVLVTEHGSYVNYINLAFQGANSHAFFNDWGGIKNIRIEQCSISFSGIDAIKSAGIDRLIINNCKISNSNNGAINLFYLNPYPILTNNEIKNTGMIPGMGQNMPGSYSAIFSNEKELIIQGNTILNSGYIGIFAIGDSFTIKNNYIDTFCSVLQDGGGIYTQAQQGINYGRKITGNIVSNGIGAIAGTNDPTLFLANGIYLDDNSAYIEVSDNTATNCSGHGLFIHNGYNLNIHGNTFYNNSNQFATQNDAGQFTLTGSLFKNNIYFSKTTSQLCGYFASAANDFSLWGTINNNYYAKPIDNAIIFRVRVNWDWPGAHFTLDGWKSYSTLEQNSKESPKTIKDTTDLRFEYNADSISKTIPLPFNYIDVTGRHYNGKIVLSPYSSVILIKDGEIANIPPVANAGGNKTITLPVNKTTLTGSGTDADGTVVSYLWTKIAGPTSYSIVNAASPVTDITGLIQGIYQFELKVTDNNGAVGKDTMSVTVNPAANIPPVANAGGNKTITLPINKITLAGSGTDADGTVTNYLWTKISGPASFSIAMGAAPVTDVTNLVQGIYKFELKVTDNNGAFGSDTIQVIVNAAANIPPMANAGGNKTITLPVNKTTLAGSGTDADGTVVSYLWTKISGPTSYSIVNAVSPVTDVTNLAQGIYQFELKVTDNNGAVSRDTMQLTVNAAANIPPVANAGGNKTITLPVNKITLTGSGTDADGTVVSYLWTKISGPTSYSIVNAVSPITDVTGLIQGTYQFELKVTDNNGAVGKDTIQVIVDAAANIPPVANAGGNKTITLPENKITLTGSGTDADGTVVSYLWTKISGPTSYSIVNAASSVTDITGLIQGTYQFELKVTDNNGAVGKDTMQVIVDAAANIPPVANAGGNKTITLPVNKTTLTGSGTDADGTIVSYLWTKIAGPTSFTIASAASPITDVSGLVLGIYQFELKVTDNTGAVGKDTMQVIVNAAPNIPPVANAGGNKTITLPVNKITLAGSGTDADGTIVSYLWMKISGPSAVSIINSASAVSDVTGLVQGTYLFELRVTDNNGGMGRDTMIVIVNAAANIPPVANAAGNKSITLPVNWVNLSGSGADADGTIVAFTWTKISGPLVGTIANTNSAATSVTGLIQGIYQFELKVTDNNGAFAKDTMQVIVNPVANIPPVANAGGNKSIQLPLNKTTLAGSGTDPDGTVVAYVWTKIGGPTYFTIVNLASPITDVSGLVQGIYKFELKITDNNGAVGRDTMQIIVNAAANIPPVANAGADVTITLPVNSVILNGSGTDGDGVIIEYLWKQVSGPAGSVINPFDKAVTNIYNIVAGTYELELTVKDNEGAMTKDTMVLSVALGRMAPTVNSINVYPNPVTDIATLEINTIKPGNSVLSIVITDIKGKTVYRQNKKLDINILKERINMSSLSTGIYTVTVFFDKKEKGIIKIVKL